MAENHLGGNRFFLPQTTHPNHQLLFSGSQGPSQNNTPQFLVWFIHKTKQKRLTWHRSHDASNHLANAADLGCQGRAALVRQGRGSKGQLLQPRGRAAMRGRSSPDFLDLGRRRLRSQLGGRTPWPDPRWILHPTSFAWLPQGTSQWGCLPPGRGQPRASAKEKASAQDQRDRSLVLAQLDTVGQLDFTCPEGIAILPGCRSQGGPQIHSDEPLYDKSKAWIGLHKCVGKTASVMSLTCLLRGLGWFDWLIDGWMDGWMDWLIDWLYDWLIDWLRWFVLCDWFHSLVLFDSLLHWSLHYLLDWRISDSLNVTCLRRVSFVLSSWLKVARQR